MQLIAEQTLGLLSFQQQSRLTPTHFLAIVDPAAVWLRKWWLNSVIRDIMTELIVTAGLADSIFAQITSFHTDFPLHKVVLRGGRETTTTSNSRQRELPMAELDLALKVSERKQSCTLPLTSHVFLPSPCRYTAWRCACGLRQTPAHASVSLRRTA
jgi:hypothetical protein